MRGRSLHHIAANCRATGEKYDVRFCSKGGGSRFLSALNHGEVIGIKGILNETSKDS
jgi:hypothetical protein